MYVGQLWESCGPNVGKLWYNHDKIDKIYKFTTKYEYVICIVNYFLSITTTI
jgi:hypothetical protein